MVRLALISATALLLALSGGLLFWLDGGRQAGTAWASADAFEMQYIIFDVPRIQGGKVPVYEKNTNHYKFEQAILGWAKERGIAVIRDYASQQSEPRFIFLSLPGGFGAITSDISFASKWIKLVGLSDKERGDLEARLAPLPGVMPPVVRRFTAYYEITSPQEVLPGMKVIINGKVFSYPVDFTKNEARGLNNYLMNWDPGQIWLVAFMNLSPVEDGQPDRLGLGEAYQLEMDNAGNLNITTLAKVWNDGRALRSQRPGDDDRGWRLSVPRNNPEKGFYPLQALKDAADDRLFIQSAQEFPVTTSLTYLMYPNERLLAEGAPKFTPKELALTSARLKAMTEALQGLLKLHPEYWDSRRHHWRISFDANGSPWQQLYFSVYVTDRDGELAREVKAVLAAAVPGLREPAERVTDIRKPPPMPDILNQPEFAQPPLEQPNPAMWLSYDGWVLRYRVLGLMDEGVPFQLNTLQAAAFRDAVTKWSEGAGVAFQPSSQELFKQGPAMGAKIEAGAAPALFMTGPDGGGSFDRYIESCFGLHLATPDEQLAASLQAALAGLPGVPAPSVRRARFYVHKMHPQSPLTGGDLVIDGRRYHFPGDFAWEEALTVSYLQPQPGHVTYEAFETLVEPERNRIVFPDVVRVSNAPDGSTRVETVLKDWHEGRKLHHHPPNVWGGSELRLRESEAAPGYDPLPGLATELRFYDRKAPGKYHYRLRYFLVPQSEWLIAVKRGPGDSGLERDTRLSKEVDTKLTAWLDAHPEYRETDTEWERLSWGDFPFGEKYLVVSVTVRDDTESASQEIEKLLRGIPGLPEPVRSREENKPSSPQGRQ